MTRQTRGVLFAVAYLVSIVVAAMLVKYVGPVPVGFGLVSPAGAYMIGVTMVLRDLTQDQIGPLWAYLAMLAGALLSAVVSPQLALAAAGAFLVSETLDQLVYTPVRRRSLVLAVLLSNTVGILADTFVFLQIAFGDLAYFPGQLWAKIASTVLAVLVLKFIYRHRTTMRPAYLVARDRQRQEATA